MPVATGKLDDILNNQDLNQEERTLSAAVLTEKLVRLEQQRHKTARMTAQLRNRLEGEVIGRYWSRLNKPAQPRDIIHRLKKESEDPETEPTYETDSKRMATMARDYHNKSNSTGVTSQMKLGRRPLTQS
jgi:alpha-ketoglutarate-dependent taurine dioxygenase